MLTPIASAPRPKKQNERPPSRVLTTSAEAEKLNKELLAAVGPIAVDSEWFNHQDGPPIDNGLPFSIQFCFRDRRHETHLVLLHNYWNDSGGTIYEVGEFLRGSQIKTLHNAPSDFHIIANAGIEMSGPLYDTMVLDHLLDAAGRENQHGLKECAHDFLGESRKTFNKTFGVPQLRKDGQPYASGALIVPTLPEYFQDVTAKKLKTFTEYSTNDVWDTLRLLELYKAKLEQQEWLGGKSMWSYFVEVDAPLTEIICKMERRGIPIDVRFMREMAEKCQGDLDEMLAKALEWAKCPLNIGSGKQLAQLLYGQGMQPVKKGKKTLYSIPGRGWPVLKTTDGGDPSTARDDLVDLRLHLEKHRIAKREELKGFDYILNYKKYDKQKNTYLVKLPNTANHGVISERINQVGTTSARWSMSSLMLIPTGEKDVYSIRDGFIAPPGECLVVADWINLELRLATHFSQDPTLIKLFENGWDMHSLTAFNLYSEIKSEVTERFGEFGKEAGKWIAETYSDLRKRAKTINFSVLYGIGHKKLSDQLHISEFEAKRMIAEWFRAYPRVKMFMDRTLQEYRTKGFSRMLDGRPRHANLALLNSENYGLRGGEERSLVNAKIQGSGAAMAKRSMIRIEASDPLRATGYKLRLQIHDELLGTCPIATRTKAGGLIREIMEQPFSRPLRVATPITLGFGPSWASAKA
jgi:DNA polymerase-1